MQADNPLRQRLQGSPEERFWQLAEPRPEGCWRWGGTISRFGYGQHHVDGVALGAHRWAYENLVGPVPDGKVLDHLCHTASTTCPGGNACEHRSCVNPAHLQPMTPAVNLDRSDVAPATVNAAKTHCPQGHPYAGGNLYVNPDGGRECRECGRRYSREYQRRKRDGR